MAATIAGNEAELNVDSGPIILRGGNQQLQIYPDNNANRFAAAIYIDAKNGGIYAS